MNRLNRWRLILLSIVIAVAMLLAAAEGVRRYASTRLVAGVAQIYGGRLAADRATAGWTEATLYGARFYEADGEHVLLSVAKLQLGLTLWDLVAGRTNPKYLVLDGAQLTLRYDQTGAYLTKLPEAHLSGGEYPRVDITNGSLIVDQGGSSRTAITGATAHAQSEKESLAITGTLQNEEWGTWNFDGEVDPGSRKASLAAATQGFEVSPRWLRQLPFVPPHVWEQVVLAGPVSAKLEYRSNPSPGSPAFHADVASGSAALTFPALDLQVEKAVFHATVEDAVATVHNLEGSVFGGTLTTSGTMNFAADPLSVTMQVDLHDVDIAKLPSSWSIPEDANGRFTGAAQLKIGVSRRGAVAATGEGKATISKATFAGVPVDPIKIDLHGAENFPAADGAASASGQISFDVRLREAPMQRLLTRMQSFTKGGSPAIDGVVSTDLHVEIPLATLKDLATYRVTGSVDSPRLTGGKIALENVQTSVEFAHGILRLKDVQGSIPSQAKGEAGQLKGSVELEVAPRGELRTQLSIDRLPLELLGKLTDLEQAPSGSASISVAAEVPVDEAAEIAAWQGRGRLKIPAVRLGARSVRNVAAGFQAEHGVFRVRNATFAALNTEVTGSAEVQLHAPYNYEMTFNIPPVEMTELVHFASLEMSQPVLGRLQAAGRAGGSLQPFSWEVSGTAIGEHVQLRQWAIDRVGTRWSANAKQVSFTQTKANVLGGKINVDLTVPLQTLGSLEAKGELHELRLDQLAVELPAWLRGLQGPISGTFSVSGTEPQNLHGRMKLSSTRIHLPSTQAGRVEASHLQAEATLEHGTVKYQVGGELLEGEVQAQGEFDFAEAGNLWENVLKNLHGSGQITFKRVQLGKAVSLLGHRQPLPITGLAHLELQYKVENLDPFPSGVGRLILSNVRWGRHEVAHELESRVIVADRRLRLPDIYAEVGDGSLQANVSLSLDPGAAGDFALVLHRVRADQVLAPWPEIASQIKGPINAHLRGTLGQRISGGGGVATSQVNIAGIDVSGARFPVRFTYSPDSGRGEVKVLESSMRLARGRIVGGATIKLDRDISLSGKVRLADLEMHSIAPSSGSIEGIGSGRISGSADFSAARFRSLDDLHASFDLTLARTQARQLPVLGNLSRYVLPSVPSSTSFQQGEVRGHLAGGVVHIKRFSLTGTDARVLADGTATLQGRLDLNVTAMSGGDPLSRGLIRRIALPIIEAETVPLTLLTRANELIADRIIYLRIGGTVRSPTVQVQVAPQLESEALRFFLNGAVGRL